eukprot:gene39602-48929_t
MVKDCWLSHGEKKYINGDVYVGGWQMGERHGQGKLTRADGTVQEGLWEKDEPFL